MVLKFNSSANSSNFHFFKKRVLETIGIILFITSFLLLASILSFNINDPSFSYLNDNASHNILGKSGAYLSDILLNLFGAASVIIFLIGFAWGSQLLFKKKITYLWTRLIFVPISIISCSISLDIIKLNETWPISSGVGGLVGKYSSLYLINFGHHLDYSIPQTYIAVLFGCLTLFSVNLCLGFSKEDWLKFSNFIFLALHKFFIFIIKIFNFILLCFNKILSFFKPLFLKILEKFRKQNINNFINKTNALDNEFIKEEIKKINPGKLSKEFTQPKFSFNEPGNFELPNLNLLNENIKQATHKSNSDLLRQNAKLLENVIKEFNIDAKVIGINPGPIVTLYELEPAPGIQTRRIISLTDDIARSMSAQSARISNVSGKNAVGVELPNQERETIYLREIFGSKDFDLNNSKLPLVFGKDISGKTVIRDLAKMPHLLIAGTTGSGKSVGLNAMILSLLYSLRPDQCKFIMIDPKMLELSVYDEIPHLITPVVTNPRKAIYSLKWLVREMENRYKLMTKLGVRNIQSFNEKINEKKINGDVVIEKIQTGFDSETGQPIFEDKKINLKPLPFIVVIIDEIADLMLVSGRDVEANIQRLSQMARAAGIHLIVATQRPSVDVITGTIKANFSSRISYQVASKIDSRTIIGDQGAEYLLGQGDMLFMSGAGNISRVHGPFVKDDEIGKVVKFLKSQGKPSYVDGITEDTENKINNNLNQETDEYYEEAIRLVISEKRASTSFIQRHFKIGYNRAANIIEKMEQNQIISEADKLGRREVLK